jgi:hypothetical protein
MRRENTNKMLAILNNDRWTEHEDTDSCHILGFVSRRDPPLVKLQWYNAKHKAAGLIIAH